MPEEETHPVAITDTELAAICWLVWWFRGNGARDDVLPHAIRFLESFAERASNMLEK